MIVTTEAGRLASPCVGTCELDRTTAWCRGCGRTGDEIAAWRTLPQSERDALWPDLRARLDVLGVGHRLLPWTGTALAERLIEHLAGAAGAWWTLAGRLTHDRHTVLVGDGPALVVERGRARLRVALAPGLRGFVLDGRRLAFAVHGSRIDKGGIPPTRTLEELPAEYAAYAGFDTNGLPTGLLAR